MGSRLFLLVWLTGLALIDGNIGVIQTMVGELVRKPEHERESSPVKGKKSHALNRLARAYAVMPFVWSIGTIIGPVIGGTFANPSVSLPSIFPPSGLFTTFPYLLPNLICASLLLGSIVFGYFFLVETHPDMTRCEGQDATQRAAAESPLLVTAGAIADSGVDLRSESYGTFNAVNIPEKKQWVVNEDGSSPPTSISSVVESSVFTRRVTMIIVALGIYTYHCMSYDHLLPIFLQDDRQGTMSIMNKSSFDVPGGWG